MKNLFPFLVLFISITGFSQDTFFQNGTEKYKDESKKITESYNAELVLTGKQQLLFQKKVEEFLIRYHQTEEKYEGREKLDILYSLRQNENAEMRNILTRPQYNLYTKLKSKIQPLETVDKKN